MSKPIDAPRPRALRRLFRALLLLWVLAAFASEAWQRLQPRVEAPAPPGLTRLDYTPSGDDARTEKVAWRVHGEAQDAVPLLLLHGSPGDSGNFAKLLPTLTAERRVLAPDLPGFGFSTREATDLSILGHAEALLDGLDQLGVERVHVLAFSMGGGPALHLWEQAPERVASLTLLASVGVQELEWLGEYRVNHALHGALLGLARLADVAIPHFGHDEGFRSTIAFARNFFESDQRPLRGLLREFEPPMLVLHGEDDFLVPMAAAREHHRLVPQSRLVQPSSRDDHFFVFFDDAAREVAELWLSFVDEVDAGSAPRRADASPERLAAAAQPFDPSAAPPASGPFLVALLLILAASTLVSEDLTCIVAGLMVAAGKIDYLPAALACFSGIFVGDMWLFFMGRWLGAAAVRRAPLSWMISQAALDRSARWFARRGPQVILLSRFLPGMRLPTYVAAGVVGTNALWFAAWFALAGLLWTPLLVALSAVAGDSLLSGFAWVENNPLLGLALVVAVLMLVVRVLVPLCSHRGRRLLRGAWLRRTRWEFWPPWQFYPPVIVYVAWLALRHRSLRVVTLVNPFIPGGGLLGESKTEILSALQEVGAPLPAQLDLDAVESREKRAERVASFREEHGLGWPIVVKPDAGQRGQGVVIAHDQAQLDDALSSPIDLIVQEFLDGPEFGVFWTRHPDEPEGEVFSITTKELPEVFGDGQRTLERLILDDPRAPAMAKVYFERFGERLDDTPPAGEVVPLAELGTHCLGAVFLDGADLMSAELDAEMNRIAMPLRGFHFGRFDLRAPSAEHLRRGQGLKIMELNGMTSEATHIYDPRHGLLHAYRVLFWQWRRAFDIAAAVRRDGLKPTSWGTLFRDATDFLRARKADARRDTTD